MACTKENLKRHLTITAFLTFALYILVVLRKFLPCQNSSLYSRPVFPQAPNYVRVVANITSKDPNGTVFTCVTRTFYYTKHFLYSYVGMGFNVIVFEADTVRLNGQVLPVHWCRVRLLADASEIGPAPLLYSDADTRVNLAELQSWIVPYLTFDGLLIMNGSQHQPKDMRTNWFVLPVPKGSRTMSILSNWASHARNVSLQDQHVFNELYPTCDESQGLFCRDYKTVGVTSWHCASHKRYRASCMQNMIHLGEKVPRYPKSS